MSPILVRPVREQLEHDRLIRLLQGKFRRKHETAINPGNEQNTPVGPPTAPMYPDLVLMSLDRGRKLQGVVEVETGESVNHLEALAQWSHFGRVRVPFHLYVPATMVDVARRLCEDNNIYVSEVWSYHILGDQPRFTMVYRNREAPPPPTKPVKAATKPAPAAPPAKPPSPKAAPAKAAAKPKAAAGTPKAPAAKAKPAAARPKAPAAKAKTAKKAAKKKR